MGEAWGWAGARILMLAPTPTHPLNFGNRRRIWHVAHALQAEGAEVHYVHYPAEADWRVAVPAASQSAMQREWASLYTVPVTRPLHVGPQGSHHGIDEWWDPAIGQMLDWLFATSRFDALVVNYTWLSRAFLHAPRGVLKVLDTHDRFSGRKELLQHHGIAPEFFYTTPAEERVALERADIVWAIKGEERDYFASLAARPAVTVPHAEPMRPLPQRAPAAIARFGLVGARNALNQANISEFLTAARAHVARTLLPCEFHVAGSCCEDLAGLELPVWVKLHGRVPSMEDFYRSVDAVLVPMRFSTGLKIRVGEALALGKAVVSLRHAFEGYQPCHPFHTLDDVGAMLGACEVLVAEPARLAELEQASAQAGIMATRAAGAGLALTARLGSALRHGLLVVVDAAALHDGSLVVDHVCEVIDYLVNLLPVNVLLIGDTLGGVSADIAWRLGRSATLYCTPGLAALEEAALRAMFGTIPPTREWGSDFVHAHAALWLASPAPALAERYAGVAFLPFAVWAYVLEQPGQAIERFADRLTETWVIAPEDSATLAALRLHPRISVRRVRNFVRLHHASVVQSLTSTEPEGVLVLADAVDDPAAQLASAVAGLLSGVVPTILVGTFKPGTAAPLLVLDTATQPRHDLLREALDAAGIPRLALFRQESTLPPAAPWIGLGIWGSARRIGDAYRSLPWLRQVAAGRAAAIQDSNDAGWAMIWSCVARARGTALTAAAARASG